MKYINRITAIALLGCIALLFPACAAEYYKEELYRKEIYMVSGENNIFGYEYEFGGDKGYLPIYHSGTVDIEHDVTVTIAKDYVAIGEYNRRMYDTNFNNYAMEVPDDVVRLDDRTVVLRSGSDRPYTGYGIEVTTDGLSPEHTYFIPLRIESVSDYMASKSKNFVLFQVYLKNDFATTKTDTNYPMAGTQMQGTRSNGVFIPNTRNGGESIAPGNISATKIILPTGVRQIRMNPAGKMPQDDNQKRNWAILVTVDPLQTVEIPLYDIDGLPTGEFRTVSKVYIEPNNDSDQAIRIEEVSGEPSWYDTETGQFHLSYYYNIKGESVPDGDLSGRELWCKITESMFNTMMYNF